MSKPNKKQFGVWMDSQHATIVGREQVDSGSFVVLGHVENAGPDRNTSEKAAHHQEITLTHTFFKRIAEKMPNVDEIHVTGTGQIQEQFMHFLANTPQYKHAVSSQTTSNKMDDKQLLVFVSKQFN
jgi:stalled ribosome rescue protein Dom34